MRMCARTWETGNAIFLAQRFTRTIGINFSDNDFVFSVRKGVRELLVYGSKRLSQ